MEYLAVVFASLEFLWVIGLVILSFMLVFRNKTWMVIVGTFLITYGYIALLREGVISFQEIEIMRWVVRIGISLVIFDSVIGSPKSNPIHRIANSIRTFVDRCTRKELE